jgi:diguanylate cyclase (GGDEF)-like protein
MTASMTGGYADPGTQPRASPDEPFDGHAHDGGATTMPVTLYQRMVRVVSYIFIAAVLVIVTVTGGPNQGAVYVLLVVGIVFLVLFQDVLSTSSLGRWRLPLEGAATIAFLTILVLLTGGFTSPYFFGYILLLGAGSLWATGLGPPILAGATAAAYVVAVLVASGPTLFTPDGLGRVAFNLVALGLVTYVAWIIGREQRRAREEALRLSRFDMLTGLTSRGFLISTVEREIPRAARTGRPFAMMMIDLDGLKAANDRFGHDSGDKLLQAVADVIRGDVRVTDVAARYAGDEFVLLLPDTDLAGALRVADKVRVDISRLALPHDGQVIRTSASIGLVTYPDDGRTWTELMRRADLAMYEAKRRGRDQVVRYAREVAVPTGPAQPTQTQMMTQTEAPPSQPDPARTTFGREWPTPSGSSSPQAGAPFGGAADAAPAVTVPPQTPFPPPWEAGRR